MRAAGLNGADMVQRAAATRRHPDGRRTSPGWSSPARSPSSGPGSSRFAVGDRVMAIVGGGAQAELCVVPERVLMAVPRRLDWPAAGGLPEVFTTAHDALFTQCGLPLGERLLVHGAAGGVGTAAVQLGVAAGARVHATVRSEAYRDGVAALGATVHPPEDFVEHGPYDVILELVGAPNLAGNLAGARDLGAHLDHRPRRGRDAPRSTCAR